MKEPIPILDLHREHNFMKKDIDKAVRKCFFSQQWVMGPELKKFEEKAAAYLGQKQAVGVASGTDALLFALRALALKKRGIPCFTVKDEIITTPFTFIATAGAIIQAGARPVFVDVDLDTYNIDLSAIKKAITKNTVGIIPVHLFGLPCDMSEIMKIAKKHGLFVVEDTAQAFGASYKGKKAGTFGDAGAFSFYPSKNLGGCGDGGMVVTSQKKLAEAIKILGNHGQKKQYDAVFPGSNSRLDSLQAAILSVKLKHIDLLNEKRRKIAHLFDKALSGIPGLHIPFKPAKSRHVYHLYTVRIESHRRKVVKALNAAGIGARVYYQTLLPDMKAFSQSRTAGKLSRARSLSRTTFSLPLHPFLKEAEINYIISICRKVFG